MCLGRRTPAAVWAEEARARRGSDGRAAASEEQRLDPGPEGLHQMGCLAGERPLRYAAGRAIRVKDSSKRRAALREELRRDAMRCDAVQCGAERIRRCGRDFSDETSQTSERRASAGDGCGYETRGPVSE